MSRPASRPAPVRRTRCAVYIRKSHDEGLERDFNSLDAQREACEAYILSQKSEGWVDLAQGYDDAGLSGATLERPALKRLMTAIEAGGVDTVVVYKVDRLTRSLGNFAKLVETFDAHDATFVSVTQQFNTTTSMGRLTLNILLSFAQFEREVTGERIRDKIAASKARGLWMGGLAPLGYDVEDRKLVINEAEADTVRHIYRRYGELGSVRALKAELDRSGIVGKRRIDRFGRATGGKPLARGALYHMLGNRLYRGEIVHRERSYPGVHDALIGDGLWQAVQRRLEANRHDRKTGSAAKQPSLLAGLVHDGTGTPMTPTHATGNPTRYRYYVSRDLIGKGRPQAPRGRRVPAGDLEPLVEDQLCRFLGSRARVFAAIEAHRPGADDRARLLARAAGLAQRWPALEPAGKRAILLGLLDGIDLLPESLTIRIPSDRLLALLDEDADARRRPDHSLSRVLAQAHRYREMVMKNNGGSMTELAAQAGVGGSYFTRILRLGFLALAIVEAILADRQPLELTAAGLTGDTRLPAAWDDQKARLGID